MCGRQDLKLKEILFAQSHSNIFENDGTSLACFYITEHSSKCGDCSDGSGDRTRVARSGARRSTD